MGAGKGGERTSAIRNWRIVDPDIVPAEGRRIGFQASNSNR
jgi:hypothetical protein